MQDHASHWCWGFILLLQFVVLWWWWLLGFWRIKQGGWRDWQSQEPCFSVHNGNLWFYWFFHSGWPQFVLCSIAGKNVKGYLINHLLSMILSGQCFVFLFRWGTEQPHQGNMNTRDAIPNTTKEVRYQIRLDPERLTYLSSIRVDGGDGCISYHMVVELCRVENWKETRRSVP